jgi:twitching motility protein PilU
MSSTFGPAEAQAYMHKLLTVMHQQGGSDLFISADFPPSMKHQGAMKPSATSA